jgi:MFS family permease
MRTSTPTSDRDSLVARFPFYYGWVILPVASLSMFISGPGQTYTVSVFVDPIIQELGWSRTMVASIYTAGSLTAAAAMILVGQMLDRYGARVMLPGVGILFGLAMLWMSRVDHPAELFTGFVAIRTLGQGSLTLIPTTLVALWFVRRRGKVMAINSLGALAGHAAFPPLIYFLILHLGWRGAWAILSVVIWAVLLLPAAILIRRSPESVSLLPDGVTALPNETEEGPDRPPGPEVNWTVGEAMRTRSFWLLLLAGSSHSLISTALVFHHVSLITSKGLDAGVAAAVLSVMAPSALVGNFITGFLSDKVPNRYLLVIGQLLLAAAMLWTFAISQAWEAALYGALIGLCGGLFININSVIWPNYYGRHKLGSIRGITTTGMVGFAALGPMPFGLMFDITGTYTMAIVVFLLLPAICSIAALLAHPPIKQASMPTRGASAF